MSTEERVKMSTEEHIEASAEEHTKNIPLYSHIKDVIFLYHIKKIIIYCLKLQENKYHEIIKETNLVNDLGSDSLDQMEIIMAIEDLFALEEIPEEEARKSTTVGHILMYIKKHSKKTIEDLIKFEDEKFNREQFLSDLEKALGIEIPNKSSIDSLETLYRILSS